MQSQSHLYSSSVAKSQWGAEESTMLNHEYQSSHERTPFKMSFDHTPIEEFPSSASRVQEITSSINDTISYIKTKRDHQNNAIRAVKSTNQQAHEILMRNRQSPELTPLSSYTNLRSRDEIPTSNSFIQNNPLNHHIEPQFVRTPSSQEISGRWATDKRGSHLEETRGDFSEHYPQNSHHHHHSSVITNPLESENLELRRLLNDEIARNSQLIRELTNSRRPPEEERLRQENLQLKAEIQRRQNEGVLPAHFTEQVETLRKEGEGLRSDTINLLKHKQRISRHF